MERSTSTVEYQKNPGLFNQQMEKLIKEISRVAEMGHITHDNRVTLNEMVDTLKTMKSNAKENPELTKARRNKKGGFEGQGFLPQEFRPVRIKFPYDINPLNLASVLRSLPDGNIVSYKNSILYGMGFCYKGKFYEMICKIGVDDAVESDELIGLVEHDPSELSDWEYMFSVNKSSYVCNYCGGFNKDGSIYKGAKSLRNREDQFYKSNQGFLKKAVEDFKEDPSLIKKYTEKGARINND